MKRNNHCCKPLHAGISFWGIGSYLMLIGICLITASLACAPAIHGRKMELYRLLWVGVVTSMLWLRIVCLQRHMMLSPRFKQMSVWRRLACLMILMLLPPVPEVMGIIKLGWRRSIVVPNFWCEHHETAGINATKLAEGIREQYFATAGDDDSPDIIISTNTGTLVTLLIRESSVYMYVLLGEGGELPMDITLPSNSNWRIEKASDGKSGALLCEVFFAPCSVGSGNVESELAEIIIDLLDELAVLGKGGF